MNESAVEYKSSRKSHLRHIPLNDVEAAQFLGVAVQTLRNWRHLCKGPEYLKLSPGPRGRVGYLIEDLNAYRVKCRVNPGDVNHPPISSDNLIEKDAHKADMGFPIHNFIARFNGTMGDCLSDMAFAGSR